MIFSLPDGYRPAYDEKHLVCGCSQGNNIFIRITINSYGHVTSSSGVEGSSGWTVLDGITFRASGY